MNAVLVATYISAMVAANLMVWWLGPWWSPINAFFLIGLDLTMRDVLQERIASWMIGAMILMGGVITWMLNPGAAHIALASAIAFAVSATADWAVYSLLRHRGWKWLARSNGSNVIGALIDSIIFPTLAFGALMPGIILMQFAAKVGGGAVWSIVVGHFARQDTRKTVAPL